MQICVARGLDRGLAAQVAGRLTVHGALEAPARDELGISDTIAARPLQAVVSALTFASGAAVPILVVLVSPPALIAPFVVSATLLALVILGGLGASAGGASLMRGAVRVAFWGALAMAATAAVGRLFGVAVG